MKSDLISIFNQLTSQELADCNIFDEMLESHYEKIKYLHCLLKGVHMGSEISDLFCDSYDSSSITIVIIPRQVKHMNKIIKAVNSNKNNFFYSKLLYVDLAEKKSTIELTIGTRTGCEEESFYESRFV